VVLSKNLTFITIIFFIVALLAGCSPIKQHPVTTGIRPYKPVSPLLHDSLVLMDSIFFDAYNKCKVSVFEDVLSEDIEFYHDRGGLSTSKAGLIESLKKNICGKVTRELLQGSIEVYPIPGYGAIQMGAHRFHNSQEPNAESLYSKFVHTWKNENDKWRITRVISLH
jgi:hypothetical protein